MKIAFDAQLFLKGEKTGIAWCAENILMNVDRKRDTYVLNYFSLGYKQCNREQADKYEKYGFLIERCRWFHDVIYRLIWSYIPIPYSLFFREKADITVFFNYVIPPGVKGRKVAFIHDMGYKACPEAVRHKTRKFLEVSLKKSCKRADKIITISEFSKNEIIKYLNVDADKIEVIPLGVDFEKYHTNYRKSQINNVKEKYHIYDKYILYLGTIEPRKNLEKLILAYAALDKECEDVPQLVLAGKKGWLYDSILSTVETLNLKSKVKFVGYVASEDTPVLLNGATMFTFPSIYEGFGLPILEAMACGIPVLTADAASMPEVAGDAAVLVNPYDIDNIKNGMKEILNNQDLREDLIKKSKIRVGQYTWERTANRLLGVFDEIRKI